MAKNLHISYLLDFYSGLLTEKQREVMNYYYNDDLSRGEIAALKRSSLSWKASSDWCAGSEKSTAVWSRSATRLCGFRNTTTSTSIPTKSRRMSIRYSKRRSSCLTRKNSDRYSLKKGAVSWRLKDLRKSSAQHLKA